MKSNNEDMGSIEKWTFTGDEHEGVLREFMRAHGFMLLKNCFSAQQIESFRMFFDYAESMNRFTVDSTARFLPGASHIVDGFEAVVTEPKLLNALGKIIEGQIAYTSSSDLHSGVSSDWHKDDGGGLHFESEGNYFDNESCCVYKVGVYLQDCTETGGLTVRIGSHTTPNRSSGTELYLASEVGDAVIFDVRITHKGWTPDRNTISRLFNKTLGKVGFSLRKDKLPFEKKSIFFTLGANNRFTRAFAINKMKRQNVHHDADISVMPAALKSSLQENDVHFYFD